MTSKSLAAAERLAHVCIDTFDKSTSVYKDAELVLKAVESDYIEANANYL